jgi:uncharacterized protein (TIGR00255 family)
MVYSMTGFARCKVGGYVLEVQTVNKKGAELSLALPRELSMKESFIRRKLGSKLQRGHAYVKIFQEGSEDFKLSKEACIKMHKHLVDIAKSIDSSFVVTFDNVLRALGTFDASKELSVDESWKVEWEEGIEELWAQLLTMKSKEAEVLVSDIKMRLDLILNALEVLQVENEKAPEVYKNKILERLESYKSLLEEDKDRVLREVILYSEKVDITEELVRMKSHISQMANLFETAKEPIGRTVDFLVQEMMREANTMGSKTTTVEAMAKVIFIKGEIEKIRQQGSNIE